MDRYKQPHEGTGESYQQRKGKLAERTQPGCGKTLALPIVER